MSADLTIKDLKQEAQGGDLFALYVLGTLARQARREGKKHYRPYRKERTK